MGLGSGSGPVATAFFGEVKERMEEQQQKLMEFQLQEAPQGPQGTPLQFMRYHEAEKIRPSNCLAYENTRNI